MTTEEKAKAYDEALDKFKKFKEKYFTYGRMGFGDVIWDKTGTAQDELDAIFPELKESDDERIIEEIKFAVMQMPTERQDTKKRCIAWLEKQKINTEGDFGRGYDCGYEACLNSHGAEWFEKQKENLKSADSIPSNCTSDAKCEDRSPKHSDSDGTDICDTPAYWRGWDDAMKQKEQKHHDGCFTCDEYKKGYEVGRLNGITAGYNKAMKEVEQKQEYPLTPDECIKPTEWSEVELTFRGEKIKVKRPFYRDDNGRGYSTTEQDDEVTWYALRAWCESHGHTPFELYPREEWSEEDEKMIDTIVYVLGQYIDYKAVSGNGSGYAIPRYSKEIDWLKSLRPSWKPSELHLSALLAVFNDPNNIDSQTCQLALTDLYEQLKKL